MVSFEAIESAVKKIRPEVSPRLLAHMQSSYEIAMEIVARIIIQYPNIPLNPDEVVLGAGLHDIGRVLEEDQQFHELKGADYVKVNAVKLGVAKNYEQAGRIAAMIRPHGAVYEQWTNPLTAEARKLFPHLTNEDVKLTTWEQAIVVFADVANLNGCKGCPEERLDSVIEKYSKGNERDRKIVAPSIQTAKSRLVTICERVEGLANGTLEPYELSVYSFL